MSLIGQLFRVLRTATVTSSYPEKTDVPDRGHRGTPSLVPERCTGATACVAVCPTGAIQLDAPIEGSRRWSIDYGRCIFCGACVLACENEAVTVSNRFELAARTREGTLAAWSVDA